MKSARLSVYKASLVVSIEDNTPCKSIMSMTRGVHLPRPHTVPNPR